MRAGGHVMSGFLSSSVWRRGCRAGLWRVKGHLASLGCQIRIKNTTRLHINKEFRRITTVSLEQRFKDKLDHYTPKLAALMRAKGGVVGTKLRPHLDKLCQVNNCSDVTEHILKILVIHGADGEDPVDVSILLDGAEILPGCCNTAKACVLLLGPIYALNLASSPTLRYTFEVLQKLFLELDVIKLPPKILCKNVKGDAQTPTAQITPARAKSEVELLKLKVASQQERIKDLEEEQDFLREQLAQDMLNLSKA
ncbi:hypothetical protein MHYP_G00277060 [Metynnis hypsauchen]